MAAKFAAISVSSVSNGAILLEWTNFRTDQQKVSQIRPAFYKHKFHVYLNFTHPFSENLLKSIQISLTRFFSHLYYPSCSESVALVGDPGRDLELWLLTPLDSWTDSSPRERRISSVIGSGSFVGEGSLGTCTVLRRGVSMQTIWKH